MYIHRLMSIVDLPIFFFVAGYFSKIGPDEPIKLFKRLLIPYILFSVIYTLCMIMIGSDTGVLFIETSFALWFLIALFAMKIFLPIMDKFKYPVTISIILALIIGFINIDPGILGITRFFAFYPVFLIGFYYNDYELELKNNHEKISNTLNNKRFIKIMRVLVLACLIAAAYLLPSKIIVLAEAYDYPLDIIKRFIVILLGIVATLILNKIFTNRKMIMTKVGENSYVVYLLHIYIVSLLSSSLLRKFLPANEHVFLIEYFTSKNKIKQES